MPKAGQFDTFLEQNFTREEKIQGTWYGKCKYCLAFGSSQITSRRIRTYSCRNHIDTCAHYKTFKEKVKAGELADDIDTLKGSRPGEAMKEDGNLVAEESGSTLATRETTTQDSREIEVSIASKRVYTNATADEQPSQLVRPNTTHVSRDSPRPSTSRRVPETHLSEPQRMIPGQRSITEQVANVRGYTQEDIEQVHKRLIDFIGTINSPFSVIEQSSFV